MLCATRSITWSRKGRHRLRYSRMTRRHRLDFPASNVKPAQSTSTPFVDQCSTRATSEGGRERCGGTLTFGASNPPEGFREVVGYGKLLGLGAAVWSSLHLYNPLPARCATELGSKFVRARAETLGVSKTEKGIESCGGCSEAIM
jgi:hypothetical protein